MNGTVTSSPDAAESSSRKVRLPACLGRMRTDGVRFTLGCGSLSMIMAVWTVTSPSTAFTVFRSISSTDSFTSCRLSSATSRSMVFTVSPGANTSVPSRRA